MSALTPRFTRWLAWAAPFALLALAIGVQTGWGTAWRRNLPPDLPAVPAPVEVPVLPGYQIEGGIASMRATVERPLFNATRRPAPTAAAVAAKSSIQRGQYVLTGTMIVDNVAIAFLKETGGAGKSRSVRKGEAIGGMLVASVETDRVRLTLGDDAEDLELKVQKGPKTTVQPAEPAPAPAAQAARPSAGVPGAGGAQVQPATAQTRARGQGTSGPPGSTAEQNLRQNRRNARAAEAQASGTQQGLQPQSDDSTPPPAPGSWNNVYRNMRQPR
ncbi:MAG: hypothetical protein HS109_15740 [Burkholderiales bacterium]|nr:hypothetical protein [Burkholderiales bacterium]